MSKTTGKLKTGTDTGPEELKTEAPISEKDEVKAAERRTAKEHKKAAGLKPGKK